MAVLSKIFGKKHRSDTEALYNILYPQGEANYEKEHACLELIIGRQLDDHILKLLELVQKSIWYEGSYDLELAYNNAVDICGAVFDPITIEKIVLFYAYTVRHPGMHILEEMSKLGYGSTHEYNTVVLDEECIVDSFGAWGLEPTNPIPTYTLFGTYAYLDHLKHEHGYSIEYEHNRTIPVENIKGSVDEYSVYDVDSGKLLVTLYFCSTATRNARKAPERFLLDRWIPE